MAVFDDLARFAAQPRLTALALSPDGARLVAGVDSPDTAGARYIGALWQVELSGGSAEELMTRSEQGESAPVFVPDGRLLFVSSRPGAGGADEEAALWALPSAGEPEPVARRAGGLSGPRVAAGSGHVVVAGSRLARSEDSDDEQRRSTRKDRKISAILHTGFPIRMWDHELGVESARLLVLDPGATELRDLAPDARHELSEASYSISADGATVATTWRVAIPGGRRQASAVLIDVASGERRTVLSPDGADDMLAPMISPDGARVAALCSHAAAFDRPFHDELLVVGAGEPVVVELGDLYPNEWAWSPDSATLYVSGDLHGRGAVVAVDPVSGAIERQLVADASYSALCVAPDGERLYALRSAIDMPPRPVVIDATAELQEPVLLSAPGAVVDLPGDLVELRAPAADGEPVHGWLCLPPAGEQPAPVLLWIHGGPMSSFNAWSWRWNPWVAVAQGWAVVLPDPALSTGYGQRWMHRAWPYRAADVFADCTAVLDSVLELPDVDPSRLACLGASFGGYMTNWVAGHAAERFGAIVTHAGLYALDQQHKTTDLAYFKTGIFGEPAEHPDWYRENSPHYGLVGDTPMLVIHGNRDYRVPISEALRLWWDLVSGWDGDPEDLPHRFLQLTGENHWVLSPANAEIWYDAVLGFCAQHVLGQKWEPSALL
ncbi:MAG TPA: prolyl oligopeptidase family serine peptidase [Jatrophihabitans sp.]